MVLLHGLASSLHTWDAWVDELASSFRLVRLDLPGHGLTGPRADGDYRTAAFVETLARFVDEIGLDTFSLAGNSMGGGISWRYALEHGERPAPLEDPRGVLSAAVAR